MLDPSFWDDLDVARLTCLERLLLLGLISHADDYGHVPADPRRLRKQLFGYDDVTVDEVTTALDHVVEVCRNVVLYEVDGQAYAELRQWDKYQKMNYRSSPQFPGPVGWTPPRAGGSPDAGPRKHLVSTDAVLPQPCDPIEVKKVKKVEEPTDPPRSGGVAAPDRWSPVASWIEDAFGASAVQRANGRPRALVGQVCSAVGSRARDDPAEAVRILDAFRASARADNSWQYVTTGNLVERIGKWLSDRRAKQNGSAWTLTAGDA